jgi:hypothetical protein
MIFEPLVRLAQTMHLSCVNINIISKWTETSFHLTHITRNSIMCIQTDFWAYGTFGVNRAPILRQINTISKHTKTSFSFDPLT